MTWHFTPAKSHTTEYVTFVSQLCGAIFLTEFFEVLLSLQTNLRIWRIHTYSSCVIILPLYSILITCVVGTTPDNNMHQFIIVFLHSTSCLCHCLRPYSVEGGLFYCCYNINIIIIITIIINPFCFYFGCTSSNLDLDPVYASEAILWFSSFAPNKQ